MAETGRPAGARRRLPTIPLAVTVGAAVWVVLVVALRPGVFATGYVHALLLFAALVLVPPALALLEGAGDEDAAGRAGKEWLGRARALQLPAALALAAAYLATPGAAAALLALPWLATTALVALAGLGRLRERLRRRRDRRRQRLPLPDLALDAAALYLPVGGAWTFADRAGLQPLGFSIVIVALTAVHFHYAGFVLPLVTGLAVRRLGGIWRRTARLAAAGVVLSVPLVAVGITATQLRLDPWVEAAAALAMAAAGALAGLLHLRLGLGGAGPVPAPAPTRLLWSVAGASLLAGMLLAALYGTRFYLPPGLRDALDIGWMQLLHGTTNALGFAAAAVWGWRREMSA